MPGECVGTGVVYYLAKSPDTPATRIVYEITTSDHSHHGSPVDFGEKWPIEISNLPKSAFTLGKLALNAERNLVQNDVDVWLGEAPPSGVLEFDPLSDMDFTPIEDDFNPFRYFLLIGYPLGPAPPQASLGPRVRARQSGPAEPLDHSVRGGEPFCRTVHE